MIFLGDIVVTGKIHEGSNSLIYRAVRQSDGCLVILKVLKQDYPTPITLARYTQEYDITRSLNLAGVVRAYSLQHYERTLVMVLEDFWGESLDRWMQRSPIQYSPMPVREFLHFAIRLAEILSQIHAANVIHKDINPGNIVVNPETGDVKIIDFGIATRFSYTTPTFQNSNRLEGTLAYLSPEQTGRMNRVLDYRTDFYSLGVTLYRLLTGQLPFTSANALELIHSHIAKQPTSPQAINSNIPVAVSAIVVKLMAKNAEDRYQSAWGIKADLEQCLRQLETAGQIDNIQLGLWDVSDRFQIPQKLYGRKAEIEVLLAAFDGVTGKGEGTREKGEIHTIPACKLMLVSGYSGIGKSALVQEIYKPITQKRGYFISGKFDQFQRNIPYSAIVSALQSFVRQLLTEPELQLQQWREKLLTALGVNGQLIIDVIPEIELIVGKQSPIAEVGLTESQNRFNLTFQRFIRVFCSSDRPLVIFLDDLQWADLATLQLIERIITDGELQSLFLIGAYRDNEVNSAHPLRATLEKLRDKGIAIQHITLTPLSLGAIAQLIAETLNTETTTVEPLAELVLQKTKGNPFFVNEFLKTLYADHLITFNVEKHGWQWDINQIRATAMTENVVELLIDKLRKLPQSTQQILQLAACIGTEFDITTLTEICEKPTDDIFLDLLTAVQFNLILPISNLDENLSSQEYKFLHDRIQQAAYALIADDQKPAVHLQIGRKLLQGTSANNLDNLFEIVDHLNLGRKLINDQSERDQLAQLNLMAGRKAKTAIAYSAALQYFSAGLEQLSTHCWQSQYALSLALYEEATAVAYFCGVFDQMEQWATVVLQQATSILDRAKVYEVKIQTLIAQFRQLDTVRLGLQVLDQLGMNLPESPSQAEIEQTFSKTQLLLNGRSIEALLDLPPMTDAYALASMQILSSMLPAAYGATPALMLLIVSEQVNLSIQHGNSSLSAYPYAMYGSIRGSVLQDIEGACQFGALALNLVERFKLQDVKGRTLFAVALFSIHGKQHLKQSLPVFQSAYMSSVEAGDNEYISYAGYCEGLYAYASGVELTQLERSIATYDAAISPLNQPAVLQSNQVTWQVVLNLTGNVENPCCLQGTACHEDEYLATCAASNNYSGFYYLYIQKLVLCYLFYDYAQALDCTVHAEQYVASASGTFYVLVLYYYGSLVRLAVYPSVSQIEQEKILLRVAEQQKKIQHWADHAPMNFQHKIDLIKAETARVLNQVLEAETYYEQAIRGANNHGYIQEEALAYELAAKFYLARGLEKFAQTYFKEAHYCYSRWGATAKVVDLETHYPQFLSSPASSTTHPLHSTTSSSHSGEALDLTAMMKASQAIASHIMLDQLLASLIKILLESTGAHSGVLMLDKAGEWVIEASGVISADACTIDVLKSLPVRDQLPIAIISYVSRMRESIVISDATTESNFVHDPYIQKHQSKSILCTPLINQGELIGIVYLENNLVTGAFTQQRVDVVQLLSGQAAIALTNAKLYAEVKERENRLTQFIDAMPVGVVVLDTNGCICYVNQMTYELSGITDVPEVLTEREVAQAQVYQAGTDQFYPQDQLPIIRSLAGETIHVDDMEFRRPDKTIPLSVSSTPIFDETGKVVYAIATFQDISDRKQAENLLTDYNRTLEQQVTERTLRLQQLSEQLFEQNTRLTHEIEERERVEIALRQKEAMNRAIITTIPDLLIWMNRQGNYLGFFANDNLVLYNPDHEKVGANIYDVLPQDIAEERMAYIRQALQTRELQVFENQLVIDDVVQYQETRIAASGEDEVLIIIRDFTEQRNSALRERKQAEEAFILEERNRMAREIHDTLAQAFTGIIVHLEAATLKTVDDPQMARNCIQTGIELARFGLTEARRSVQALRPQLLTNGDLYSALNRLAEQLFSYTQTQIASELVGELYFLPSEVENNLFRIGQEALTNAAKYAQATEIQIDLVYEPTQCILRIKDDGQGFLINNVPMNNGFGLLGMTERAERIGAHLTIQSVPGEGTEVIVSVTHE